MYEKTIKAMLNIISAKDGKNGNSATELRICSKRSSSFSFVVSTEE